MAKHKEPIDDFGLTSVDKRLIREDAERLRLVREKLVEARAIAAKVNFELQESLTDTFDRQIASIEALFSTTYFTRALMEWSWFDQIRFLLKRDKFLSVATVLATAFLLSFISQVVHSPQEFFDGIMRLFSLRAHASSSAPETITAGSGLRYLLLLLLVFAQITSFVMLGFAKHEEARKFAADFLKMSLGIYVGAVAKLLG